MTYLVMEVHLSYSVVLDEDGRFIKAVNRNHEVGQTVEGIIPYSLPSARRVSISALSAAAACFALVFSLYWNSYLRSYATVYLSINPEVRMEVSKQNTVVGILGLNADGVLLAEDYDFRGKRVTEVSDELIERAIGFGYLTDGGKVTIDIDSPDEQWFKDTGIVLRQSLDNSLTDRMFVSIVVKQYEEPPAFQDDSDSPYGTEMPVSTESAAPATALPTPVQTQVITIPQTPVPPATVPPVPAQTPTITTPPTPGPQVTSPPVPPPAPTPAPASTVPPTPAATPPYNTDDGYGDTNYGDTNYGDNGDTNYGGDGDSEYGK